MVRYKQLGKATTLSDYTMISHSLPVHNIGSPLAYMKRGWNSRVTSAREVSLPVLPTTLLRSSVPLVLVEWLAASFRELSTRHRNTHGRRRFGAVSLGPAVSIRCCLVNLRQPRSSWRPIRPSLCMIQQHSEESRLAGRSTVVTLLFQTRVVAV